MKKYFSPLFLTLTLTIALLAACEKDKGTAQQQMPPMPVSIFEVKAQDSPWPAAYQAQTEGSRAVSLYARVQGNIEKRLYTEGQYVQEGQLLFEIERDQYEALVQQAAAQFDSASREWKRIQPLFAQNAVSQKDRDTARAAFESARASLRQAKINLEYCSVVAPVSGYTSKESLTVGNLVNAGTLLTSINKTDPMNVNFSIAGPERMRRQTLAAQGRLIFPQNGIYKAKLRLLDGSMYDQEGVVDFIDTQVEPNTGAIKARATFPNADNHMMPGQYVRIFMEGDILKNAILIPQKAVMMTQKGSLAMIVTPDNKIQPAPLKISLSIGENYLVEEGLKGGERIVLEGLIKARPGATVRIVDPKEQQAQATQQAQKAAPQKQAEGK
ncbi:MAG: efflux RND transporter periplasmic adaptor subunit [Desulfovibrionaceae bacterium]|nr:efflux RND transporter periplasmic adaptor subunit [Desulfovibrionaceae bacterium]